MALFHLEVVRAELARRKGVNPRYSLRGFASHLEMDPSTLSRILSGHQALSHRVVVQLVTKLKLPHTDALRFVRSVLDEAHRQAFERLAKALRLELAGQPALVSPQPAGL